MLQPAKTNAALHKRKTLYSVSFVPRVAKRVEHLLPKRLLEGIIFFVSRDIEPLAHAVVCLKLTPKERPRRSCPSTVSEDASFLVLQQITFSTPPQFGLVPTRLQITLRVVRIWRCHIQHYRLGMARSVITVHRRYTMETEMEPFDHGRSRWTRAGVSVYSWEKGEHRGKTSIASKQQERPRRTIILSFHPSTEKH